MSRAVLRLAVWTLGPDREEGASPPIRHIECTTCSWQSETSPRQEVPDLAALEHSGRTGHTGYREVVTAFLRAAPTGRGGQAVGTDG